MPKIGDLAVYALDDEANVHWFLPGDEAPAWAAKQWGEHVFAHGESLTAEEGPPPRAGKGSSEAAWRSYAESHGVDVSKAEGRDDIIDSLEKAGVAVE